MRHHGLRRLSLPISQARHEAVVDPRQGLPVIILAARSLSSRPLGQARHELSTVVDRWTPQQGFIRAWGGWANSTLALAQLQSSIGFTVPSFKARAAILFEEVGVALARADEKSLADLVTPSCLRSMLPALKARPRGQRHSWTSHGVTASIKQIRLAHAKQTGGEEQRRYAQVTCVVDAAMVYEISGAGETASTGSSEAPHQLCDVWVYERALGDGGSWRLKERLGTLSELQQTSQPNGTGSAQG